MGEEKDNRLVLVEGEERHPEGRVHRRVEEGGREVVEGGRLVEVVEEGGRLVEEVEVEEVEEGVLVETWIAVWRRVSP